MYLPLFCSLFSNLSPSLLLSTGGWASLCSDDAHHHAEDWTSLWAAANSTQVIYNTFYNPFSNTEIRCFVCVCVHLFVLVFICFCFILCLCVCKCLYLLLSLCVCVLQAVLAVVIVVNLQGILGQFREVPVLWASDRLDLVRQPPYNIHHPFRMPSVILMIHHWSPQIGL